MTRAVHTPPWTPEDRALLAGLQAYEESLCVCGHPRQHAWHSESEGWWETQQFVCHACTARAPITKDAKGHERREPAVYTIVRPQPTAPALADLPPFVLGVTTSAA